MEKHLTDEEAIRYAEAGSSDQEITRHLEDCSSCRRKVDEINKLLTLAANLATSEPPEEIEWNFSAALEEEKARQKNTSAFGTWQIAAAVALLIVGFMTGKWMTPDKTEEVIALRSQVDLLKEISLVSPLQTYSASERIQAVNIIEEEKPGASDKLIATLMKTLNSDDSPNVRYAAAQALNRFIYKEEVRLALTASLERQSDPLIQLSLISMLVEAQERGAIRAIKNIMNQETTSPEVKKQAEVALEILI